MKTRKVPHLPRCPRVHNHTADCTCDSLTAAEPVAQDRGPNRQKFASLVKKLDPLAPDYATQVAKLEAERATREQVIRKLLAASIVTQNAFALSVHDTTKKSVTFGMFESFNEVIYAAIERWVVDNL